jgi:hypothetical protein
MTETCRHKQETINFMYIYISSFVCVTCLNEIRINARNGIHTVIHYLFLVRISDRFTESE